MERLLKPGKLSIDPNSAEASDDWIHWISTFKDYARRFIPDGAEADADKLSALCNCINSKVYKYVRDCKTFVEAEKRLEKLYVKQPNEMFARYLLRSAKQKPNQTLADFKYSLVQLTHDIEFRDVTAAQYRDDLIRDSFINGIQSSEIRQRLLEHKTLSMEGAYEIAVTIDNAKRDNQFFCNSSEEVPIALNAINMEVESEFSDDQRVAAMSSKKSVCYRCGSDKRHDFQKCKAGLLTCHRCGKKGHIIKACRQKGHSGFDVSTRTLERRRESSAALNTGRLYSLQTQSLSMGGHLNHALVSSEVKGKEYRTLLDTGSSKCFVNESVSLNLGVKRSLVQFGVDMAQASSRVQVTSCCKVDIKLLGATYKGVVLYVMKDLCVDIILGNDFLGLHKEVVFQFNGAKDALIVPVSDYCAVIASKVKAPSLFRNLRPGWRPVITKSRRFNARDHEFMMSTVDKWKEEGTVRISHSCWRAQCVVVKRNGEPQRLAIDYSQTINLFTEVDGFPIPLIEDVVNNLASFKFFASYDLRKAYHQVLIPECDKAFTAFEAGDELLEFNVIPFGVTNGGPVFQRVMTEVIKEDRLKDTFVYFDNVVIGADSLNDLKYKSQKFKEAINRRSMTLNEKKTVYGVQELNMLGYCVGGNSIKPDPERLSPLLELPPPSTGRSLKRVLGLFAYYARWVPRFSDRICKLKSAKTFPLSPAELADFESLKKSIAEAALQAIDETLPFTVECDASDVAVSATLNQGGRPVAFMSRSLSGSELLYPSIEKEATAIIEAVRKWSHLLMRQHFVLVTDQRSVAFMLDARKRTKIKNTKIMCWRLELASFSYSIRYRPGELNVGPDTLTRATLATTSTSESRLLDLHRELCCPGITRFWNFVKCKNLPYSLDDVKKCCRSCPTCAEVKPQFYVPPKETLIKATRPMERLALDFKGPLPSAGKNCYFLSVIDEYSRYPFCFPCPDTSSDTVIRCLESIFGLFGSCNYVHSDRGSSFMSKKLKDFLLGKGIASSRTTPYHPQGNGQCERYNGIIWRSIKCALKSRQLPLKSWEVVVPNALDSIRSLLCTATGESPHSRFLTFTRRSSHGKSLPKWMSEPGPVLLRKFVRTSKNDDMVQRVELLEANPMYALVKYPDGRESNVSLRDLAPLPLARESTMADDGVTRMDDGVKTVNMRTDYTKTIRENTQYDNGVENAEWNEAIGESSEPRRSVRDNQGVPSQVFVSNGDVIEGTSNEIGNEETRPRRSIRYNKGVPPQRYGYSKS